MRVWPVDLGATAAKLLPNTLQVLPSAHLNEEYQRPKRLPVFKHEPGRLDVARDGSLIARCRTQMDA